VVSRGFRTISHKVQPNVPLQEKGLVSSGKEQLKSDREQLKGDARVVPEGGTAMVYVTHPDRRAELIPKPRGLFAAAEGVDQVYGSDDFPKIGLPTASRSDQAPDLVLAAKPDYAFSGEREGNGVTSASGGTHGYLSTDPKMQAIFIA
jgi:hypothetical protein